MSLSKPIIDAAQPGPKRRGVEQENRVFQMRWEEQYFFTEVGLKPMCLVCHELLTVNKEYHLRRHYSTRHEAELKAMNDKERVHRLYALKEKLRQ